MPGKTGHSNNKVLLTVIKGTLSRDFWPSVFFYQTIPPGTLIHGLMPFWNMLRIFRDTIDFWMQKFCMQCQWYDMQEKLGSPFKFVFFFLGGLGRFGNIYVFIDIPFKGCQGRLNRSSNVHAVSMTLHASCMRCQWHLTHFEKFEYCRKFEFIFDQGPRTDVLKGQ
jgi:hypothetical protein